MDARDVQDAAGLIKRQADEIDRLRARVAELEAMERRARNYLRSTSALPSEAERRPLVEYILGEE